MPARYTFRHWDVMGRSVRLFGRRKKEDLRGIL